MRWFNSKFTRLLCILFFSVAFAEAQGGPRIEFDRVEYDFGKVAVRSRHVREFSFTNTGDSLLVIEDISRTCGCTPFSLDKKEYGPGESGSLKVQYHAGTRAMQDRKRLFVTTNDPSNERITLTIFANVLQVIEHAPEHIRLSFDKKNGGLEPITISSTGEESFSIASFISSDNLITANIDHSEKATKFEIHPKIDTEKWRADSSGVIRIDIEGLKADQITIPFETVRQFEIKPASFNILNVKAGQSIERDVIVVSNYGEAINIEKISSKSGNVKLVEQELTDNGVQLRLSITPSEQGATLIFNDIVTIPVTEEVNLKIPIRGFYARD